MSKIKACIGYSALTIIIVALGLPTIIAIAKYLMQPTTAPFDLTVSFYGFSPSSEPLSISDTVIDQQMLHTLIQLELHGKLHGPESTFGSTTTNPTGETRVLMLAEEPVMHNADLVLPSKGSIVYILKNGTWQSYPSITNSARQRLRIECDTSDPGAFSIYITGVKLDSRANLTTPIGSY